MPWILLFIVTILFILFVCIRMSVTTHYFKYYVGEQEVHAGVTSCNDPHSMVLKCSASAFNTVGQGSLSNRSGSHLSVPWFTRLCGRKRAAIILFVTALICTGAFYFFKPPDLMLIFVFQIVGSIDGRSDFGLVVGHVCRYGRLFRMENRPKSDRPCVFRFDHVEQARLGCRKHDRRPSFWRRPDFVANVVQNLDVLNGLKAMMSIIPSAVWE